MESGKLCQEEFMKVYKSFSKFYNQNETRFLDGILLGSLLFTEEFDNETLVKYFKDWQDTADEMDIRTKKRIMFYFSHVKILQGRDFKRKRDLKRARKVGEETDRPLQCPLIVCDNPETHGEKSEDSQTEKEEICDESSEGCQKISQISKLSCSKSLEQKEQQNNSEANSQLNSNFQSDKIDQKELISETSKSSSPSLLLALDEEASNIQDTFSENCKICVLCNKSNGETMQFSECHDNVHNDCFRMLIKNSLFDPTEALRCPILSHRTEITRPDILKVCDEDQMVYYDSCRLIEEFEKQSRTVLWCPHCKRISYKSFNAPNKCRYCSEQIITLKSKFKYGKLVLNPKDQLNDTSHYRSIKSYIASCKEQIQRCEICLNYKHKFPDDYLKCNCVELE
ncbi:unnamed protein product [Moneuplotes crassus]|uniref:Uncharacterized protein n=1 Tax=Euplotes crassus TaxID=5936 RepID=A0AAD1X5R1_EUPCR|nr:unnamed protein product [Moneuplotes crassus]